MSAAPVCPECGAALQRDARRGVCPRCAVRQALAVPAADSVAESGDSAGAGVFLVQADGSTTRAEAREFGDFELLEEIGRGGMGVIFKARQRSLDRLVALKLIRSGSLAGPGDIARFQTEAAAAARLQHPHIVAVYGAGEVADQQYYAMEFVPGRSLAHALREGPFASRRAAHLLRQVAEAIEFAHQKGVLHRDLKPANILLDLEGEPRVADFGLAKILQHDSELTVSGAVIGSPQYMPPEQARGRSAEAGPAADVYSLGAILYELLTGRPPFTAATALETMKLVVEREPVAPRALNPQVPRDLETICLKCLAKEPRGRYATARELADELGRFERDEPILARPVGAAERAWRWARRRPTRAALATVLAVAPVVIITILLLKDRQIEQERGRLADQLYAADVSVADRALADGDYGMAERALAAHDPGNTNAAAGGSPPGFEWRWLCQQTRSQVRRRIPAHRGKVNTIAYSNDGRRVLSVSEDDTARIWDAEGGQCLRCFAAPGAAAGPAPDAAPRSELRAGERVYLASFGARRGELLLGGSAGLSFWDAERGGRRWEMTAGGLNMGVCLPNDSGLALAWGAWPARPDLALVDLATGRVRRKLVCGLVSALCWSADGRTIAVWENQAQRLSVFAPPAEKPVAGYAGGEVVDMCFLAGGGELALLRPDGRVDLLTVAGGRPAGQLLNESGPMWAMALSPNGRWLATGGNDQSIHLWDLPTRREVRRLRGHDGPVWSLAFSPDSRSLASGGWDGTVSFWDVEPPPPPAPMTNVLGGFRFAADSRSLLTQGTNGWVRWWELPGRRLRAEWAQPKFESAAFAPGGGVWLAGREGAEPTATLRHLSAPGSGIGMALRLTNIAAACTAIELGTKADFVVTGHADGTVAWWELSRDGARLRARSNLAPAGKPLPVDLLVLSRNQEVLAAARFAEVAAATWRLSGLTPLASHSWGDYYSLRLALGPAGDRIATSGDGQLLRVNLWDDRWRGRPRGLRGHLDTPTAFAFSPDGRSLVTGGADGLLLVWHLPSERMVTTLLRLGPGRGIVGVEFSPDGEWLGAADAAGLLHLFHAPPVRAETTAP